MREMVKMLAKTWLLSAALCGLCAPVLANTTAAPVLAQDSQSATTFPVAPNAAPASPVAPAIVNDKPAVPLITEKPQLSRLALLLPLHSEGLGQAVNAIQAGFLAAYEVEKNGLVVNVIDSGETAEEVLNSYKAALAANDVVIGPLSRSAVSAVAQSDVSKPTIALNQTDQTSDNPLPQKLLIMGLSIEDEARQIALWAGANKLEGKAFVVSASEPWQRRAAKAFAQQWTRMGRDSEVIELSTSAGYLSASGLAQLKTKMQNDKPILMFAALNAVQTKEIRMVVGKEITLYGTSQLNTTALVDQALSEPAPELNGVRLLDLPWQLQADHAAVMIYPHMDVAADQKRNVDMERLYALGIDAFRVAKEITMKNSNFEIDGVTGRLSVRFGLGAAHFERVEQQAIYREGGIVPMTKAP